MKSQFIIKIKKINKHLKMYTYFGGFKGVSKGGLPPFASEAFLGLYPKKRSELRFF